MQYTANGTQPRPRMAYGAAGPRQQQMSARQELFAGAGPVDPYQQQQVAVGDMDTRQVMQHAVDTHKDTTAAAERSLKIVEQTKEIQASTQAALRDQGEQMHRIGADMDRIGEDLSYSERILRFMRLCCCVGFFCSCCTEPTTKSKNDAKWRGSGHSASQPSSYSAPKQAKRSAVEMREQQRHQQAQQQAQYPGVSTQGLAEVGFGEEAAVIQDETQKQDHYLDEISKGLDQIKFGAQRMNEELRYQEAHADRIRQDADALQSKLHTVNRQGFKGM